MNSTNNVIKANVDPLSAELENRDILELDPSEVAIFSDLSLDLFCVIETGGAWRPLNLAWQRVLGWTTQELANQPWMEWVHPEAMKPNLSTPEQSQEMAIFQSENFWRHQDGSYRLIAWRSHSSETGVFYAVGTDITEQRQTEAQLKTLAVQFCQGPSSPKTMEHSDIEGVPPPSPELYRISFEQAPVGIAYWNFQGQLIWVNQRYCDMVGYENAEMIGRNFQDLTDPDDRPLGNEAMRSLILGQVPTDTVEKRYIHKNGKIIWVKMTVARVKTPVGFPDYLMGVVEDISDRKHTETEQQNYHAYLEQLLQQRTAELAATVEKLHQTSSQYRTLVENFPNGLVALFDHDLHCTVMEGSELAVLGICKANLAGKTLSEFLNPYEYELALPYYQAALNGEECSYEGNLCDRIYQFHLMPVRNELGEIMACMLMAQNITASKQAESENQKSLMLLRATLDATADGILVTNLEGNKVVIYNRKFLEMWRLSESDMTAIAHHRSLASALAQLKDPSGFLQRINQLKNLQIVTEIYDILEFKDGRIFERHSTFKSLGEENLFVASLRDITAKKQAEDALRASESQMRQQAQRAELLNQLANQIRNSLDLETILQTAVREIHALMQMDRCHFTWYLETEENSFWQIVQEARDPLLPSILGFHPVERNNPANLKLLKLEIFRVDDSLILEDQIIRDFLISIELRSILTLPLKTQSGKIGCICCTNHRESRPWTDAEVELLQTVCDQLAIAINQADLYEQTCIGAKVAREKADQLEQTLKELQRTQAQLIQTEKMSSLGQLVAGVAHEINNPVNFIYGNILHIKQYTADLLKLVQLYQQYYPDPAPEISWYIHQIELEFVAEDFPKSLDSMKVGAERIREIVMSLRNFSRLDEAEMKAVDLHEGIESTLMILENRLRTRPNRPAILVVKNYGNLPLIECYAGQLNQVFMNILTNAIDALEMKQIKWRTEPINQQQLMAKKELSDLKGVLCPILQISTEVKGDRVMIIIADNGCGMKEQERDRIFDPFFTTKPVGRGTGLGLSISYQIVVEKHQGQLKCISAPGKGTELTIEIPIRPSTNRYSN